MPMRPRPLSLVRYDRPADWADDAPAIDIRILRRQGWIVPWKRKETLLGMLPVAFDLTDPHNARFEYRVGAQLYHIPLKSRYIRWGRRWFFSDATGALFEKVYWKNDRLLSRKAAGLTYASQSRGILATQFDRRNKAQSKLDGTAVHGPPRGANKKKLQADASLAQEILDLICDAVTVQILTAQERRLAQRHASADALNAIKQYVTSPDAPDATAVVTRFTPLIDQLKETQQNRRLDGATEASPADWPVPLSKQKKDARIIELRLLQRLGYLKPGLILGAQICWPEQWVGIRQRKLFFLLDLREPTKPCAIFLNQYKDKLENNFFWLHRSRGKFGRDEYSLVAPHTGRLGRVVRFSVKSGFELFPQQ